MEELKRQRVAMDLNKPELTRTEFIQIYNDWWNQPYDWRIHLGLIMSPLITKSEFVAISLRHQQHIAMKEETLAQMGRFDLEQNTKEELLHPFWKPEYKEVDFVVWRIANFRLTGQWPRQ